MSQQSAEKAVEFIQFVRDLVAQALQEEQRVEYGQVSAKRASSSGVVFDVVLESDESVIIPNVLNQSDYDITVGDQVVIFIVEGSLSGAYIIGVRQKNSLESSGKITERGEGVGNFGLEPQQVFSLQLAGPIRVVSDGSARSSNSTVQGLIKTDLYCIAEGRFVDGNTQTVWWKIGQPFDGAVYSAWLTLMAAKINTSDWSGVDSDLIDAWDTIRQATLYTAQNSGFLVVPTPAPTEEGEDPQWTFTSALSENTQCLVRVRTNSKKFGNKFYGLQVLDVIFENYA